MACVIFALPPPASAEPSAVVAKIPGKGRKTTTVDDFIVIPTTVLLFRPLQIKPEAVELYCSPSWLGAILLIDGVFVALNEQALAAVKRKMTITLDGAPIEVVAVGSKKDPLDGNTDVARKLSNRSSRDCHPPEPEPAPVRLQKQIPGNSTSTAYAMCAIIDAAGFASSPCEVSGWNSAIKITADVRGLEGRAICAEIISAIRNNGWPFAGWSVEIYSPFSGDKTVAFCR